VVAVAEIKRLQRDLDTAKGQLDAEKKRVGAKDATPPVNDARNRAGTVDTQALYEKIKTLELKKEKEVLYHACAYVAYNVVLTLARSWRPRAPSSRPGCRRNGASGRRRPSGHAAI
jgi:hypothetical protein